MAVAALVLGIIGTLFSLVGFLFFLGIPLGLIALILGIVARKNLVATQQPSGLATAGIVLGSIGVVVGLGMFALCSATVQKARQQMNDPAFQEKLHQQQEFNEDFQKAVRQHQLEQQQQQHPSAPPSAPGSAAPTPPAPGSKPAPATPQPQH